MKLIRTLFLIFPFLLTLFSCPESKKSYADLYYKSVYLGSDSFQLEGLLFNRSGNPVSGNKIIAKIANYELDDWNVEGNINNNRFTISINKTGYNDNSLPIIKNDDTYRYDTVWEVLTPYFSVPVNKNAERDKKMYRLNLYINEYDFEYDNMLYEFIGNKPTKYFSYSIDYVYIPEPVDISGAYRFEDELWEYYYSFNCDFSKPGWYKIFFDIEPIGNNQAISSSLNTRYYKN